MLDNTIVTHYYVINDKNMGELRDRGNLEWKFCT
jgi:hypothetical protein